MTSADRVDLGAAPGWVIGLVFGVQVVVALSLLLMVYLTLTDRLPRNRFFGVRTKWSRASDEAWRYVHRRVVPFAAGAAVVVLGGLVPMGVTAGTGPGFAVSLVVTDGVVVVLLLVGTVVAHRGVSSRRSG